MAEDLSDFLEEKKIKVAYIHSDIVTLERAKIIRDLRLGKYDVLVGINLLREGIDLPEVSTVAILDADKEGFLRGKTALIQTIGRAARHINGRVIMYADRQTEAMKVAIIETNRRRKAQINYNLKNHIMPKSTARSIQKEREELVDDYIEIPKTEKTRLIRDLRKKMELAALNLEFEKAAKLRDEIILIEGK
ncbi:MAG: excinuclease ABC subunit B [Candidatus Berkelbacteria bacterium Athens1014_28]|uniref:UvrABC system protein B n=1 Tax=Candidatus Berkelbacteria bacterium Athens1014_28 TaxID=2017145 RepID=A0A554LKY4_9BACT|nr:MAG: excinuclease ABC subunit B [Candidatus Berkelbacteria bacterium Athens1014_28]